MPRAARASGTAESAAPSGPQATPARQQQQRGTESLPMKAALCTRTRAATTAAGTAATLRKRRCAQGRRGTALYTQVRHTTAQAGQDGGTRSLAEGKQQPGCTGRGQAREHGYQWGCAGAQNEGGGHVQGPLLPRPMSHKKDMLSSDWGNRSQDPRSTVSVCKGQNVISRQGPRVVQGKRRRPPLCSSTFARGERHL